MAEELLNNSDAAFGHEPGCEGVAEHVGCEFYVEYVAAVFGADALNGAGCQGGSEVVARECVVLK
jgi:hypothetical protein